MHMSNSINKQNKKIFWDILHQWADDKELTGDQEEGHDGDSWTNSGINGIHMEMYIKLQNQSTFTKK